MLYELQTWHFLEKIDQTTFFSIFPTSSDCLCGLRGNLNVKLWFWPPTPLPTGGGILFSVDGQAPTLFYTLFNTTRWIVMK